MAHPLQKEIHHEKQPIPPTKRIKALQKTTGKIRMDLPVADRGTYSCAVNLFPSSRLHVSNCLLPRTLLPHPAIP